MLNDIFARCMAISMSHFLNTPYKEQTITEMYAPDGFANKASGILSSGIPIRKYS